MSALAVEPITDKSETTPILHSPMFVFCSSNGTYREEGKYIQIYKSRGMSKNIYKTGK